MQTEDVFYCTTPCYSHVARCPSVHYKPVLYLNGQTSSRKRRRYHHRHTDHYQPQYEANMTAKHVKYDYHMLQGSPVKSTSAAAKCLQYTHPRTCSHTSFSRQTLCKPIKLSTCPRPAVPATTASTFCNNSMNLQQKTQKASKVN